VLSVEEGFRILTGVVESSQPADVDNPSQITRPGYTLQHPGNWTVDTGDEDYDPDIYFDLNAPAQGTVIFQLGALGMGSPETVDATIDAMMVRLIRDPTLTSFTSWGSYSGYGREAHGTLLVAPGRVRVFGGTWDEQGILVTEIRYDEDEANNKVGYDLIEASFKFQ
jgi:hypothetical protein